MKLKAQIPIEVLRKAALEEGCTLTEKSTCVMVKRGTSNNRLYIARTRDVSRVNVNGFKVPDPELACTPPGGTVGTFLQVVRFDCTEARALQNFRTVCRNLDAYEPAKTKPRGRPAALKGSKKLTDGGPILEVKAEETKGQHMERLVAEFQAKKAAAAKMGFPLSKKTVQEYEKKIAELGGKMEV